MKIIKSNSIGRLHELAVASIVKKHALVTTEDKERTIESEALCLVCETPMDSYRVSSKSLHGIDFMEAYAYDVIHGTDKTFSYTYHDRLFAYGDKVNQIDYIVEKIKCNPETRRACAVVWNPLTDCQMAHCPCLQFLQCHVDEFGKLDMYVIFRSNDMLSAFGSNAYALTKIQALIAEKLDLPVGTYTHISLVPHIYYIRDAAELSKFKD